MRIFLDALSRIPTVSVGTQALIIGALQILRRRFPEASFVMLSSNPTHERSYLDATGYPIEYVARSASQLGTLRQLRAIVRRVDAVASAWGDGYVGTPAPLLLQKAVCLKRRGVPLILVTASLGPFDGALNRVCARMGLGLFDCLTVREPSTQAHLAGLGLGRARAVADSAFVLDPAPPGAIDDLLRREGVPQDGPLIGVNPSILLHHRFPALHGGPYAPVVAALVAHLREATGAAIVLIPHQIYPSSFPGLTDAIRLSPDGDDRAAAGLVLDALAQGHGGRHGVYAVSGDYSPGEYKGLIGRCAMFVGGRMHAVISAVSMHVPSVILRYSHKADGVMAMLGLEDCLWDATDAPDRLLAVADTVWADRNAIRENLASRMPAIVQEAYQVGDLLADVMAREGR
jgi:colanic acid/amylovoran biosynthesis protein